MNLPFTCSGLYFFHFLVFFCSLLLFFNVLLLAGAWKALVVGASAHVPGRALRLSLRRVRPDGARRARGILER